MDFFQSPLAIVLFGVYALVVLALLSLFFRSGNQDPQLSSSTVSVPAGGEGSPDPADFPGSDSHKVSAGREDMSNGNDGLFREEAEKLFSNDRDPVFVMKEDYHVIYCNRAAGKLFGNERLAGNRDLADILEADPSKMIKAIGDPEKPRLIQFPCVLPNGKDGDAQVRIAVLNRLPRIYAVRVVSLDESRPGWLARPGKSAEGQTSLTRGGHLDFREIDPASVELSADQMLAPLRDIDGLLSKVSRSDTSFEGTDPALQSARAKLRKLIRHIEEIDWMLQVTDGQLHLNRQSFSAYEVLSNMADAANRVSSEEGPRLELDPPQKPTVEPILAGDQRIFEKVLTQLLTSAFRSADGGGIKVYFRIEPLESPHQSDDWYLFAGEDGGRSQASRLTIRIGFNRFTSKDKMESDLPAVIETLGSTMIDPKLSRRLDYVRKGRDSDLFGLTLARELVSKMEGELAFRSSPEGMSEFVLSLQFDNAG